MFRWIENLRQMLYMPPGHRLCILYRYHMFVCNFSERTNTSAEVPDDRSESCMIDLCVASKVCFLDMYVLVLSLSEGNGWCRSFPSMRIPGIRGFAAMQCLAVSARFVGALLLAASHYPVRHTLCSSDYH